MHLRVAAAIRVERQSAVGGVVALGEERPASPRGTNPDLRGRRSADALEPHFATALLVINSVNRSGYRFPLAARNQRDFATHLGFGEISTQCCHSSGEPK